MNNIKDLDIKVILSGGINIKNVDNAIDINPWCIDLNSGVELSPGVKNINLIKEVLQKL
jgi:phosphoribosylanthranilate isomerase